MLGRLRLLGTASPLADRARTTRRRTRQLLHPSYESRPSLDPEWNDRRVTPNALAREVVSRPTLI